MLAPAGNGHARLAYDLPLGARAPAVSFREDGEAEAGRPACPSPESAPIVSYISAACT